mgnify:CR=1 FL=1
MQRKRNRLPFSCNTAVGYRLAFTFPTPTRLTFNPLLSNR